eukprot:14911779-Ditylum_brightwellii.AAC.1
MSSLTTTARSKIGSATASAMHFYAPPQEEQEPFSNSKPPARATKLPASTTAGSTPDSTFSPGDEGSDPNDY